MKLVRNYKLEKTVSHLLRDATWYASLYALVRVCASIKIPYDLTVVLEDDERVRALNTEYRGLKKTTDVLSFTYPPLIKGDIPVGEVIISVPQAKRQALRYRTSLVQEMARLLIHGYLHVHGYDHIKESDRVVMRPIEKKVMTRLKKEKYL